MKKLALTIAALSLSAGAAFAENPYVSRTDVIQSGPHAGEPVMNEDRGMFDSMSTGSIRGNSPVQNTLDEELADPSANRSGDADPGSVVYD
ncbi:MAG: hypothetical protein QHC90_11885 [Shinella sp.]|jgi:hypothetical protein|nr:hypothetical protein [Shinella sp.]